MLLEGKKIFITGGCSGMGFATARLCVAEGAQVTIFDFADDEAMAKVAEAVGGTCHTFHGDVTDSASVDAGIAFAVERMGGLDGVVNCAGGGRTGLLVDIPDEDFDWTVKLCLYGTFYVNRAAARAMIAAGKGGSIVNFSSINADMVSMEELQYDAAKAGVNSLTRTAAVELARYGIRVNGVRPGFIRTEKMAWCDEVEGLVDLVEAFTPDGRLGRPDDVAEYVAYLLSDKAAHVNGTLLAIDGGTELGYPGMFGMPPTADVLAAYNAHKE